MKSIPSASSTSSEDNYNLTSSAFTSEFMVTLKDDPQPVFGHENAKKFLKEVRRERERKGNTT